MIRGKSGAGCVSTGGFYPPLGARKERAGRNQLGINQPRQVTSMRIGPLAIALLVTAFAPLAQAQDTGLAADEQILLKQVMTDKKTVYAENLGLTEEESARFWPVYDEYEAKQKVLADRFLANLNNFASKYDTLTDEDAAAMLKEKMAIEKDGAALRQTYTKKIAKELPPKKALRYAQLETRIQNMIQRDVYSLIPLAR
jgi:hypothetical protein